MNLTLLFPHSTYVEKLDSDYFAHIKMLYKKAGILLDAELYSVTKFLLGPDNVAPFYQSLSSHLIISKRFVCFFNLKK